MTLHPSFGFKETSLQVGQMAKHCQVSPRTVHRWVKENKLESFQLPSGHYRVRKKEFRRFLIAHDFPLVSDYFDFKKLRTLIVDKDNYRVNKLSELFQLEHADIEIFRSVDLIEAALLLSVKRPQFLFLSLDHEDKVLKEFVYKIRMYEELKSLVVFAVQDAGSSRKINKGLLQHLRALQLPATPKEFSELLQLQMYSDY